MTEAKQRKSCKRNHIDTIIIHIVLNTEVKLDHYKSLQTITLDITIIHIRTKKTMATVGPHLSATNCLSIVFVLIIVPAIEFDYAKILRISCFFDFLVSFNLNISPHFASIYENSYDTFTYLKRKKIINRRQHEWERERIDMRINHSL